MVDEPKTNTKNNTGSVVAQPQMRKSLEGAQNKASSAGSDLHLRSARANNGKVGGAAGAGSESNKHTFFTK